jgi:hypothetical protein
MQPRDFDKERTCRINHISWRMHYPIRVYGPDFRQPESDERAVENGIYLHPYPQRAEHKLTLLIAISPKHHSEYYQKMESTRQLDHKKWLAREIHVGAKAYWRRRQHREYAIMLVKAFQRAYNLPEEIARMILGL